MSNKQLLIVALMLVASVCLASAQGSGTTSMVIQLINAQIKGLLGVVANTAASTASQVGMIINSIGALASGTSAITSAQLDQLNAAANALITASKNLASVAGGIIQSL